MNKLLKLCVVFLCSFLHHHFSILILITALCFCATREIISVTQKSVFTNSQLINNSCCRGYSSHGSCLTWTLYIILYNITYLDFFPKCITFYIYHLIFQNNVLAFFSKWSVIFFLNVIVILCHTLINIVIIDKAQYLDIHEKRIFRAERRNSINELISYSRHLKVIFCALVELVLTNYLKMCMGCYLPNICLKNLLASLVASQRVI